MEKQIKHDKSANDDRILFAFLATFLGLLGFLIAILMKRDDKYVMFYAKQSLVISVIGVVLSMLTSAMMFIPFLRYLVYVISSGILLVFWIFSWVNALSGIEKETPIIGNYAKHFNF